MKSKEELKTILRKIDYKSYQVYKDTKGEYQFEGYVLIIEHVQSDPFASPSQIRIIVRGKDAKIIPDYYDERYKRIAVQDYILRNIGRDIYKNSYYTKGSGKSGILFISKCGQEILDRSACQINKKTGDISIRMEIGFPANGRTINARELEKILFDILPNIVKKNLFSKNIDKKELSEVIELAQNQQYIRAELLKRNLVAFIADGSILPRETGVSQKPKNEAIIFKTPDSMKVEMDLPNGRKIYGMGIAKGITLIVGGGYHGKSTLMEAIERGVYNHISGDGREYVITENTAIKVRAEDGRSIIGTDVSMFIKNLPNGIATDNFNTENASGSTSQAANVIEAMEAGGLTFLIDEDTSATNFMIRDKLMQSVVTKDKEPIIPYIDRVKELYEEYGISTILVAGSSGEYFYKADKVIQMDEYNVYDITDKAKRIADKYKADFRNAYDLKVDIANKPNMQRKVCKYNIWNNEKIKIKVNGKDGLIINKDCIDTRYIEQLIDVDQLRAVGYIIKYMNKNIFDGEISLQNAAEKVINIIEKQGLEEICERKFIPCNIALPRKMEICMVINRFRKIKLSNN